MIVFTMHDGLQLHNKPGPMQPTCSVGDTTRFNTNNRGLLMLTSNWDFFFLRLCGFSQDPVVHVSVASVLGDVSTYVTSSSDSAAERGEIGEGIPDGGGDGSNVEEDEEEEEEEVPSELCLPVSVVLCKAGTTYFEAPLLTSG